MSDDDDIPAGRFHRFVRMAALGPRAGLAIARDAVGRARGEEPGEQLGEVLFETLGKLKGGSLKAGQLIAQVSDGLPEAARVRLGRLFSSAPTLRWEAVAEVLETELGRPPDEVFAQIDHEPFAGASLGQVHRAELADGTRVAVKVQYPGVAEALEHDLDLLHKVMGTVSGGGLLLDVEGYFEALRADTLAELDYRREAEWLSRMQVATQPWPDLVVPKLYSELCTGRVLTTAVLEGDTLFAYFDRALSRGERDELGFRVVRAVLGPLLRSSVVNADAHPGNFVVLDAHHLGLLDFGAATEVPEWLVQGLRALIPAVIDPRSHDVVALLAGAGMGMRRPDRAVLEELVEVVGAPLRGTVDFAADATLEHIGALKQRHPIAMLRTEADPHMLPVFRALVGVYYALKHLKVRGDLGQVLLDLSSMAGEDAPAGG